MCHMFGILYDENMMGNIYNSHMSGNNYIIFEVAMISPHSDYKQTLTSPDMLETFGKNYH